MVEYLDPRLLAVILPLVLFLAIRAPLHVLLLLDLIRVVLPGEWHLGGLRFDPSDIILVAILARFTFGRERKLLKSATRTVPHLKLWTVLGILLSISYLLAPQNADYLTDPVRIAYQLFRYGWKTILYYPLVVLLFNDARKIRAALLTIVVAGDLCSLLAIPQGYGGLRAGGPFTSGNALGAALIYPLLICFVLLVYRTSKTRNWFAGISIVLILRALLFSGSRGAFVGALVALALLAWAVTRIREVRPVVRRWILAAPVLVLALMVAVPNLLERPNVRRLLSASEGTEASTLQWRMEFRWPHFWNRALDHRWFGTGTEADPGLGRVANTPHNAYLAVAVKHGFPALGIYLVMAFSGCRRGLRMFRRSGDPWIRLLGVLITAGILALLVHGIVDSVFMVPFVGNLFWMMVALPTVAARSGSTRTASAAVASRAPRYA